jgi:hypothetical protein
MLRASWFLSLEMSQRGDSGMNQMAKIWMMDGAAWPKAGTRQLQSLLMRLVPKVNHVQMMAPT